MTTYTNITKASGTTYTTLSGGKTLFDDSATLFDSTSMLFDGNDVQYTNITKASGTSYTNIPKAT